MSCANSPLTLHSPAPQWVLSQIQDDRGLRLIAGHRLRAAVFKQFWGSDETVALTDGSELVALAGRYVLRGADELWFCAGPALARRRHAARRSFLSVMEIILRGSESVVSSVRTDIQGPVKLARLLGFQATGQVGTIGPITFEVYQWDLKHQSQTKRQSPRINARATAPQSKRKPAPQSAPTKPSA